MQERALVEGGGGINAAWLCVSSAMGPDEPGCRDLLGQIEEAKARLERCEQRAGFCAYDPYRRLFNGRCEACEGRVRGLREQLRLAYRDLAALNEEAQRRSAAFCFPFPAYGAPPPPQAYSIPQAYGAPPQAYSAPPQAYGASRQQEEEEDMQIDMSIDVVYCA
jgi:hypothetical protein